MFWDVRLSSSRVPLRTSSSSSLRARHVPERVTVFFRRRYCYNETKKHSLRPKQSCVINPFVFAFVIASVIAIASSAQSLWLNTNDVAFWYLDKCHLIMLMEAHSFAALCKKRSFEPFEVGMLPCRPRMTIAPILPDSDSNFESESDFDYDSDSPPCRMPHLLPLIVYSDSDSNFNSNSNPDSDSVIIRRPAW